MECRASRGTTLAREARKITAASARKTGDTETLQIAQETCFIVSRLKGGSRKFTVQLVACPEIVEKNPSRTLWPGVGSPSRGTGACMACHRAMTTSPAASTLLHSPVLGSRARNKAYMVARGS
jgi:hypothetical protein